jgi:hypothetical protein
LVARIFWPGWSVAMGTAAPVARRTLVAGVKLAPPKLAPVLQEAGARVPR